MRLRRWQNIALSFVGLAVFGALVFGLIYKVPVVVFQPGEPSDSADFVTVLGVEPNGGESQVLITTTVVVTEPPALQWLWLRYVNDFNEFEETEQFFGTDTTEEEVDAFNDAEMVNSQNAAELVALDQIGLDVSDSELVVAEVIDDTAAVGVVETGDVITEIDGTEVKTAGELIDFLVDKSPGDTLELTVLSPDADETEVRELVLGEFPDEPDRAFVGIQPGERVLVDEEALDALPFQIEFDSNEVGGPSAGLALTIEILDQLSEGDLLGGTDIAFTGTIRLDGSVGGIGGLPQKAVGVRDFDVDTFIIPVQGGSEENLRLATEFVEGGVNIIEVSTLQEALDAIEELGGNVDVLDGLGERLTAP